MNKKFLTIILSCFVLMEASSQTLFTYGKNKADAKDFLRAYSKNNTGPVTNKTKSINDYLDLYIKSRLKIQEAYQRRYDTLPQIASEVKNLRTQIMENYMTEPGTITRLVNETFQRSLKDIHIAHIFISYKTPTGTIDSQAAKVKKDLIEQRLKKGDDFLLVAQEASDDPAASTNKGDLGYITVLSLPYEFENAIYATPVGKYSAVVQSKIGYHIFKNLGERKAIGKIKAQQILLALPPGSDEATKKALGARADSLYKLLLAGESFNKLATDFSNDYVTAAIGGIMPDIGVGQYDPVFENVLWSLPKDGAISKPFLTSHGWHIVKRISLKPVITDPADKTNLQDLQQRLVTDSRWKSSRNFIYDRVTAKGGYKKFPYEEAALRAMTDSMLDNKPIGIGRSILPTTRLFSIGDNMYDATMWLNYARAERYPPEGMKTIEQLWPEFVQSSMLHYYQDHLEDFNDEFRMQMNEFKDGNMFFEIMQQEIWSKAQADTVALMALYNKNKKNYTWQQSADAVLFFCPDMTTAKTLYEQVKKNPANWRAITEPYSEKVISDSARYEWNQVPNIDKITPKAGLLTTPLLNENDNSASFAYIVTVYPQPMQRSFNEARGLVINDYQTLLEDQWTEALKKKYPVVIDQKVLAAISK